MRRRFLAAFSVVVLGIAWNGSVAAQEDPGRLLVIVTDAVTKAPIDDAQVFILGGGLPQTSLTNSDGSYETSMTPGSYSVVAQSPGYEKNEPAAFDIIEQQRTIVRIALEPSSQSPAGASDSSLKTIAHVHSKSSASISTEQLSLAELGVSTSIADALSKVGGVVNNDLSGVRDSAFNISIRGHDASQTGYSLDGVPVVGGAQMLGAASSLFSGASVNFSPTAGSLGGTIGFQTIQPTKLWSYQSLGTIGNFGVSTYSFAASGSSGRFMFAMQHAQDTQDSFRSGLYYGDQSGEGFEHQAATVSRADLLKVNYQLTKSAIIHLFSMVTNLNGGGICSDDVTLEPCGYGSVPTSQYRGMQSNGSLEALVGNVQVQAFASLWSGGSNSSQGARVIYNVPMSAYAADSHYDGQVYGANASVTSKRHSVTLYGYSENTSSAVAETYDGVFTSYPQPTTHSFRVGIGDRVSSNDRLALDHSFSYASASYAGSSLLVGEGLTWKPNPADTYQAGVYAGSAQPSYAPIIPISDPLSASYDCYNGSTFLTGSSDVGTKQSSMYYNFSAKHVFRKGASVSASAYRNNSYGQIYRAAVPADGEPDSFFPGGFAAYVGSLEAIWSQPTVCGSVPFNPSRIYIGQGIAGLNQVYQGYTVSAQVPIGSKMMFDPTYTVTSSVLTSLDPRLQAPNSYYAVGTQLPHTPLVSAGATLEGFFNRDTDEWVLNAQYLSANNGNNLPGYTTFNVGLVTHVRFGTLTFVATNLFGTHTGLFTYYQGINPMPLAGGGTFAYATTPLPPRQWQVTWRIPWHQHVSPPPKPPIKPAVPKAGASPKPTATATAKPTAKP